MTKPKLNYIVDFLAFIFFVISAISGLAMLIFMPSGVRQGRLQEFLGIQKGAWTVMHNLASIILVILVIIHFILHWEWIVRMTKEIFKTEKHENEPSKNQKIL